MTINNTAVAVARDRGHITDNQARILDANTSQFNKFFDLPKLEVSPENKLRARYRGFIHAGVYDDLTMWLGEQKEDTTLGLFSYGGDLIAATAIYSLIKEHSNVNIKVEGVAYSAASVILMAGKERTADTGSVVGIHQASTLVFGKSQELRDVADNLDTMDQSMIDIYSANVSSTNQEEMLELFYRDSFINGKDAVRLGLLTSYGDTEKEAATKTKAKSTSKDKPKNPYNNPESVGSKGVSDIKANKKAKNQSFLPMQ